MVCGCVAAARLATNLPLAVDLPAVNEATFTWSGQLPPRNNKDPLYSCKVFLGGVPWDITEGWCPLYIKRPDFKHASWSLTSVFSWFTGNCALYLQNKRLRCVIVLRC